MFRNLYLLYMKVEEHIKGRLTRLSDTRVAVEITLLNEVSLGVLYFEKPKVGWTNKPLMPTKWRCVDAKVEGVYQYKGSSVTPLQLMKWAQDLVEKELHTGGENNGDDNNPNDYKSENVIPSLNSEFKYIPTEADEHNKSNDND